MHGWFNGAKVVFVEGSVAVNAWLWFHGAKVVFVEGSVAVTGSDGAKVVLTAMRAEFHFTWFLYIIFSSVHFSILIPNFKGAQ